MIANSINGAPVGTLRDERDIWSFEYAPERIWELACLRVIRFTVIADMVKMMSR
ncbi:MULTISPECIES: hypothetical protein [Cupriavidus]|uniref:hypothetical protein n=1 Tax=Cupriavidus TaxID=106589 RepID=UPI0002F2103D|nr:MULTISPECIES: hypothetical protein [Cupriavidus]QYY30119.1 hypothetical protein K2O51_22315 [Cupriavidus pinatubonensis]